MSTIKILETCPKCDGTGIDTYESGENPIEKPCENCGAVGTRELAFSDDLKTELSAIRAKTDNLPDDTASDLDDIMDKCNEIKEKCDEIKEVVDEL